MSNYWQRWIGDWKRKTAHLSACQKGVYGELLDHLYASDCAELPQGEDMIFRIAGAVDDAEREAVRAVLAEFFRKTERGFVNTRVAEEIAKRGAYVALRRAGAQKRWAVKPGPAKLVDVAQQAGFAQQRSDTSAPKVKAHKGNGTGTDPLTLPDWIDADQWNAWIATRPARARKPKALEACIKKLTAWHALGHDPNAIVADSLSNGWQGLFAPKASRGNSPHASSGVPPGHIKCRTCGAIVGSYTDGQCDPCWRAR